MASLNTSISAAEKPTIVVVQGSFQTHLPYVALEERLRSKGYPVTHPILPSCSNTDSPDFTSVTLADDALTVRSEVTRLVDDGKTVVLVMHSYGGLVGNEAVTEELSFSHRKSKTLQGGVIYLYMFAAFIVEAGKTFLEACGEPPEGSIRAYDGKYDLLGGAKQIYNDLPSSEASLWESRMIPQSYSVMTTKRTRNAYNYIPSTYLICEGDLACPPKFQETFVGMTKSHVERCDSDHSPNLSQTEMLAGRIVEATENAILGVSY